MIILALETSCDETAASLVQNYGAGKIDILGERVYSQTVHNAYGGVVPELASRDHIRKLGILVQELFDQTSMCAQDVNYIAVTTGPGLPGALLVGTCFAQGFAFAHKIPILGINHMEGHVFGVRLSCGIEPPFLCLLVSGGHTEILHVADWGDYRILGSTVDDAAGEAFDKIAQALGLPYPGGPAIQNAALGGNRKAYRFPRAMRHSGDYNLSFSGLKTAAVLLFEQLGAESVAREIANISASFQEAVVDALLAKTALAAKDYGISRVAFAGGVAANVRLREKSAGMNFEAFFPQLRYCTDNASMIAAAAAFRIECAKGSFAPIGVNPNWQVDEI